MNWDGMNGCEGSGAIGTARHQGAPLTVKQIKALEPGIPIVVTWSGGNGPWEGTVVHDDYLGISYTSERESGPHALLHWPETQAFPLNRVTLVDPPSKSEGQEGGTQ